MLNSNQSISLEDNCSRFGTCKLVKRKLIDSDTMLQVVGEQSFFHFNCSGAVSAQIANQLKTQYRKTLTSQSRARTQVNFFQGKCEVSPE